MSGYARSKRATLEMTVIVTLLQQLFSFGRGMQVGIKLKILAVFVFFFTRPYSVQIKLSTRKA